MARVVGGGFGGRAGARKLERPMIESQALEAERLVVLLVEDNPIDADLVYESLQASRSRSLSLEHTDTLAGAFDRLATGGIDAVLLDLNLPDSSGLETLTELVARHPAVPIVVLTGVADESFATRALECGAQDFLCKGLHDGRETSRLIARAVTRHARTRRLYGLIAELQSRLAETEH